MENLADLVLDTLCFLGFTDDEHLDPQTLRDWVWPMYEAVRTLPAEEQAAMRRAAQRRLEMLTAVDAHGYSPRQRIKAEEFALLESLNDGLFFSDGVPPEASDPVGTPKSRPPQDPA